jgi:hypothetical protein
MVRWLCLGLLCLSLGPVAAEDPFFEQPVKPATPPAGAAPEKRELYIGAEGEFALHSEDGLDKSKGDYSVGYNTLGGSITGQYHFPDFYFAAGLGLMRLMSLRVNGVSYEHRQWHVPVYARAYYKLDPMFALGAGLTHLTETTMYLNGEKVPNSSYNQIFLDLALQVSVQMNEKIRFLATPVLGINLIPGRQHTYSVGDLFHVRFACQLGAVYLVK